MNLMLVLNSKINHTSVAVTVELAIIAMLSNILCNIFVLSYNRVFKIGRQSWYLQYYWQVIMGDHVIILALKMARLALAPAIPGKPLELLLCQINVYWH